MIVSLSQLLQATFSGVGAGVVYGLLGIGFVITQRITGVLNFAQGHIAVTGAFAAVLASRVMPIGFAVLVGALVAAAVSAVIYLAAVWPLRRTGLLEQSMVTLACSILMLAGLQLAFGTDPRSLTPFSPGGPIQVGGAALSRQTVWIVVVGAALTVVLYWFFERTSIGTAVRACAVNRYAAEVVGINVTLMAVFSFALSGLVSGAIAAAQAPLTFVTFSAGLTLTLKGFVAAAVAGMNNVTAALVGGVLLGLLEAWSTLLISSSYQNLIALALLLGVLILRPTGLAKVKVSERV
jgi:branched-chain amino acid transport system permease protein